jgi:YVTN family beta-propeller protein
MADVPPGSQAGLPEGEGTSSGVRTFLIADVRGYTRFTHEHGDEAAAELAGTFAQATRVVAGRCGGNVIELRGDEALVVFASARQALRAAIELQEAFIGGSDGVPALPLGVGIGVDAGEAVPLEQGFRGAALNLAARLCSQAQPGEVLASESVTHLAGRVKGLEYRESGRLRLKGMAQPVRAYEVVSEGAARVKRRRSGQVSSRARWTRVAIAAALLALVIVTFAVIVGRPGSAHALARIDANSAGAIDPGNNRLVDQVRVRAGPGRMAAGFGSLWVVNAFDASVSRIDPASGTVEQTFAVGPDPTAIAVGAGLVWVASSGTRSLIRIDPQINGRVGQRVPVGNGPSGIAISPGTVWVTNRLGDTVTEIDSKTGHVRRTLPAGGSPSDIVYAAGSLWIANESSATVTRLDPGTGGLEPFTVGNGPEALAAGDGSVWAANSLDGTVSRIDTSSGAVTSFAVGPGPSAVLVSGGSLWVADSYGGRIVRIDPDPAGIHILRTISVGSAPQSLAAIDGRIWLSARDTAAAHRGGTLRVFDFLVPISLDEAIGYDGSSWSTFSATADGLVAFKRVSGLDGGTLVPDLAASLPRPGDGGRVYTFHLRRGIRYSNGEPVRASDLRRALERDFRIDSPGAPFYADLVGAGACSKKRCDLSRGVVTDDTAGTVTLNLRRPDPELFDKLATPFANLVPPGVSMTKIARLGVPGTGPYMIRSYAHSQLVLVRNPHFREWSAAAQPDGYPDRIVSTYNDALDRQLTAVERGAADLMRSPPADKLNEVETRYAAQVHVFPNAQTWGIFLNTRVPPFDNRKAREAFNYAIDRGKVVAGLGGAGAAAVTCQILPAGTPGYRPFCPYTRRPSSAGVWRGPDLARALRLVAASGTRGEKVIFWTGPKTFQRVIGRVAVATLDGLGYSASLKVIPPDKHGNDHYFDEIDDSRNRAQAGFDGWSADYPAASNFFTPLFTCAAFQPASEDNQNDAEICDRQLDQAVDRALTLQITEAPAASNATWSAVDNLVTKIAPWAPLLNTRTVVFVSRRAGNVQSNPQAFSALIDQIWVR